MHEEWRVRNVFEHEEKQGERERERAVHNKRRGGEGEMVLNAKYARALIRTEKLIGRTVLENCTLCETVRSERNEDVK